MSPFNKSFQLVSMKVVVILRVAKTKFQQKPLLTALCCKIARRDRSGVIYEDIEYHSVTTPDPVNVFFSVEEEGELKSHEYVYVTLKFFSMMT